MLGKKGAQGNLMTIRIDLSRDGKLSTKDLHSLP